MSIRASLIKVYENDKGPESFRNCEDAVKRYFNTTIRKLQYCRKEGIAEGDYKEADNYFDYSENLYSEDNAIIMTRVPRDQVEFAVEYWKTLDATAPIIKSDWNENDVYTAGECITFFDYCLKNVQKINEYDYIYLMWS